MRLGLGIDTGGTYTDGVIFDFESNAVIARKKHVTTPYDLSVGISGVLGAFPGELLCAVGLVSLSTTLATNACVEGKGSRTALFLLGYEKKLVDRLGDEYGLRQTAIYHIPGRHGQRGEPVLEPDWDELRKVATEVEAEAIGVSEYWGVRNPEYEIRAKQILREATGLPIAAAHELSTEINSLRRAATTCLNARLIPLIEELIASVKRSLLEAGVSAPLMIVRGDGSLMTEDFAREKPVETLLSGPAASVSGGMKLSGLSDFLAVDIGGTTTDLAIVRNNLSVLSNDGVDIGDWRTGTRAIGIRTIGLGGDSAISFDKQERLTLGPRRAVPLCALSAAHPEIKRALSEMIADPIDRSYSRGEFVTLLRDSPNDAALSDSDRAIVRFLANGPRSVDDVADAIGTRPYFMSLENLEFLGIVIRSTLTPTDLIHISGDFTSFDTEASSLGAELLAMRMQVTVDEIIDRVFTIAGRRLYRVIADYLLERSSSAYKKRSSGDAAMLDIMYEPMSDEITPRLDCGLPLVGIGAPTHLFLPKIAEKLRTEAVVPADAGVANAVGAITGSILAEEIVIIKPHYETHGINGYSCHSAAGYFRADEYEEAVEWAEKAAIAAVRERAKAMGAENVEVVLETEEQSGKARGEFAQSLFLEFQVIARGLGKTALA